MPHQWRRTALFAETKGDGEPSLKLENSGKRKLQVPGCGLPVPIELPAAERFAHGFGDWTQERLTAREIAMLRLINAITDKPSWHVDVHSPKIVEEWAEEAFTHDLISQAAWDWCLAELRDMAALYEGAGATLVFDSASRICKADTLIASDLLGKLTVQVESLALQESGCLVDPDLFPLVYGRTRVLADGGHVGCTDAVNYVGRGETLPDQIWSCPFNARVRCDGYASTHPGAGTCARCGRTSRSPQKSWMPRGQRFSAKYQWLPAEVKFEAGGVRLTSYVNNLHPRRHQSLYKSIERYIEASIRPWNEVLVRRDRGKTPERIRTYGVQWNPPPPQRTDLDDLDNIISSGQGLMHDEAKRQLQNFIQQPDNPRFPAPSHQYPFLNQEWAENHPRAASIDQDWAEKYSPSQVLVLKYRRVKTWLHPEPGESFTYEEWKGGRNNRAVVPGRMIFKSDPHVELPPREDHQFYTLAIDDEFRDRGLQVIVKIGCVELTPEQPTKETTDWELSGLPNEHIVATTVVYFASENVTGDSGSMSFRVEADLDPIAHVWGPKANSNPHHPALPLSEIYGFASHLEICGDENLAISGDRALQIMGTVQTPDGRLVAYPNVMQSRTEAFSLSDPRRSGRRRFMKLYLVDPHYRILSTRNTPPQQHAWWREAGLGRIPWELYSLPRELVQEIESLVGKFPMSLEEAEERRKELRMERKAKFHNLIEEEVARYEFGEWAMRR